MDESGTTQRDEVVQYKTPKRVQAWFLQKSRNRWRRKYRELKQEQKRLRNCVADVSKSREKWRQEVQELRERNKQLEADLARLRAEGSAAFKKGGATSR
jgi:predicted  nucleic acid-binding Zn-ribbon protein